MTVLDDLLDDLAAESGDLERLVGDLPAAGWGTATPAVGWTVAHQVAHLAWTDEAAAAAASDAVAFQRLLHRALTEPDLIDVTAAEGAAAAPTALLARWRDSRALLATALRAVPAGQKLPWFGPPMSPASMATARIMETWAHGQDVADALGVRRVPTDRLRHVAWIGVRTRDFAFVSRGLPAPAGEFRVELTGPDGTVWTWGPDDAEQVVSGPALDFCLLVTQRRHRADLELSTRGPDAERWLEIAQAFAGPAGAGRAPGQFAG